MLSNASESIEDHRVQGGRAIDTTSGAGPSLRVGEPVQGMLRGTGAGTRSRVDSGDSGISPTMDAVRESVARMGELHAAPPCPRHHRLWPGLRDKRHWTPSPAGNLLEPWRDERVEVGAVDRPSGSIPPGDSSTPASSLPHVTTPIYGVRCPAPLRRPRWTTDDVKVLAVLGGNEELGSIVRKVRDRSTGTVMAMKSISKDTLLRHDKHGASRQLVREISIHASLDHESVVRFLVAFEDESQYHLCTEFIKGKSMLEALADAGGTMSERSAQTVVAAPMLRLLTLLHARGIIHRDINASNILIDESNDRAVLIDFGIAISSRHDRPRSMTGTPGFMAPEVSLPKDKFRDCYGTEVDIYSLGAVVHLVIKGELPTGPQAVSESDTASFALRVPRSGGDLPPVTQRRRAAQSLVTPEKPDRSVHSFTAGTPPALRVREASNNVTSTSGADSGRERDTVGARPPRPLSSEVLDWVDRCLKESPTDRATAFELAVHPWLRLMCEPHVMACALLPQLVPAWPAGASPGESPVELLQQLAAEAMEATPGSPQEKSKLRVSAPKRPPSVAETGSNGAGTAGPPQSVAGTAEGGKAADPRGTCGRTSLQIDHAAKSPLACDVFQREWGGRGGRRSHDAEDRTSEAPPRQEHQTTKNHVVHRGQEPKVASHASHTPKAEGPAKRPSLMRRLSHKVLRRKESLSDAGSTRGHSESSTHNRASLEIMPAEVGVRRLLGIVLPRKGSLPRRDSPQGDPS